MPRNFPRKVRAYVMGEFASPAALVDAVHLLRQEGYDELDTYSPYPIEGGSEALGLPRSKVPLLVLGGGVGGAMLGYLLQWYCNVYSFPIPVGGRPLHSAPAFIPITFEVGILLGACGAFFGLLALLGLPQPYHPIVEAAGFDRASIDRFWLSVAWRAPPEETQGETWEELVRKIESLGGRAVIVRRKS